MKALVKKYSKPGLWMQDVSIPQMGPNDVLIKIEKTAICGTDLHIYNWDQWSQKNVAQGLVTGHEFFGRIVEHGDLVTGFSIDERVSGEGHITCGVCRNCRAGTRHLCRNSSGVGVNRQGAFAEFLVIPAVNVFKIPDEISDEVASIFDPFGNAVHTALSFGLVGEDVLITGAGPIGLMAAAVARHVGARQVVVTDINPSRLELALKMGATYALDPCKEDLRDLMPKIGVKEGFDVGLEMSGNPGAFESMLQTMNHGGKLALLGLFSDKMAIDWTQVIFKGLVLKGIYGREIFETWYKMSSMLQSGLNIQDVITHRMRVDEFINGFELLKSGEAAKVVLDWT